MTRCKKHEWKFNGSYTEYVQFKNRATEHYRCRTCGKSKRIVPSLKNK